FCHRHSAPPGIVYVSLPNTALISSTSHSSMRSSTPISRSLAASSITPLSHIENAASTNRLWSLSNSRSITLFRTLQRLQVGKCLIRSQIPQNRPLGVELGEHFGPVFGVAHLRNVDLHDASYVAEPRGLPIRPFLLTVKEKDGV